MKEKLFKKETKRKLFSVVLALAMVVALIPMNTVNVYAETKSGTFGNGDCLTWSYDTETKTLTIEGTGAIPARGGESPWGYDIDSKVQTLVIGDNVTSIGMYAGTGFGGIKTIKISASVESIGRDAFSSNERLESVIVEGTTPASLGSYGSRVFSGCSPYFKIYVPASSVSAYKAAEGWSAYEDKIFALPALPEEAACTTHSTADHWKCTGELTNHEVYGMSYPGTYYSYASSSFEDYFAFPQMFDRLSETPTIGSWYYIDELGNYIKCDGHPACEHPGMTTSDKVCGTCGMENPKYTVMLTEGELSWTQKTDEALSFRSSADITKFVRVEVDDKEVAVENYDVTEGSTIVTLKANYLETLEAGKHTISIVSAYDGEEVKVSANFEVKAAPTAPKTGDATPIALYVMLMAVAGAGIVATKKRKVVR